MAATVCGLGPTGCEPFDCAVRHTISVGGARRSLIIQVEYETFRAKLR